MPKTDDNDGIVSTTVPQERYPSGDSLRDLDVGELLHALRVTSRRHLDRRRNETVIRREHVNVQSMNDDVRLDVNSYPVPSLSAGARLPIVAEIAVHHLVRVRLIARRFEANETLARRQDAVAGRRRRVDVHWSEREKIRRFF